MKLSNKILHFLIVLECVAIVWKIISTRFYINGADHTTNQTFQFRHKLTDVTRNSFFRTLLSSSQQETGHIAILIEENNELFLSSPYESQACLILPMIYQLFSGQPISFLDFDDAEITRHAHRALNSYIWAHASLKSSWKTVNNDL